MSVIVKGMEMPESCAKCKLKTWTNTDPYCTAIQSKLEWNKYSSGSWVGIDKRCPIRPLPEKHGRLIDESILRETVGMGEKCEECKQDPRDCEYNRTFTRMDFCGWIDDMETIVEAEV